MPTVYKEGEISTLLINMHNQGVQVLKIKQSGDDHSTHCL